MRKLLLIIFLLCPCFLTLGQNWSGATPGDIYYNTGNVGIGTTAPNAKLSLYQSQGTGEYPTSTTRGDVIQTLRGYNNIMEFGVSREFNARKAWVLSRHSDVSGYGYLYSTLHLQPDLGVKTNYQGVAIGYNANQALSNGVHLAVNGKVGIGTIAPQSVLHINHGNSTSEYPTVTSRGDIFQLYEVTNNALEIGLAGAFNSRRAWILSRHNDISGSWGMYYSTLHLQPDIGDKSKYQGIAIGYNSDETVAYGTHLAVNGKVGIGTTSPDTELTVNGTIHSKEVKVDLSVPGPDYVFEEDYDLPSLESIQHHIKENKHLPEVPSASEMEEKGIDLGVMNMLLLKKVEELTLHLIDQNEKVERLEKEIQNIKNVNHENK